MNASEQSSTSTGAAIVVRRWFSRFSPAGEASPIVARIRQEQLGFVLRDARNDSLMALFWSSVIAFLGISNNALMGDISDHNVVVWIGLIYLWIVFASMLIVACNSRPRGMDEAPLWLHRFALLYVANGMVWALMIPLMWHSYVHANHLMITVIVLSLILTYAMEMSSHHVIFAGASLPPVLTLWVYFYFDDGPLRLTFLLLLPPFVAVILYHGRKTSDKLMAALELRLKNEFLAGELVVARDQALEAGHRAEVASAAKSQFLARMSHELRTPLNAILGFSDIISKERFGPVGSGRYVEYAGDINASGRHLLSLINDTLDLAKIESGQMELNLEKFDLILMMRDTVRLMKPEADGKEVSLFMAVKQVRGYLNADQRAMRQIFFNIISNAVKFTQAQGRVALSSRLVDGDRVEIMIEDTGPGIPSEQLSSVLAPFSQVDNRYDLGHTGTGLGLAVVNSLVELHGGNCRLESEAGHGTKVIIELPGFHPFT